MFKVVCCQQEARGPLTSLISSPRGAAVRQGLEIIEQAHRMGGPKIKLPLSGVPFVVRASFASYFAFLPAWQLM